MKIKLMAIAMVLISLHSCKKDTEDLTESLDNMVTLANNYTQLDVGNYWVYERKYINYETGEEQLNSTLDSIYIAKDTIIDELEYKMFGGSWFGLNFSRIVRNDGPNLVSFDNKIFMSTEAIRDTIDIRTNVSNNIDSIYKVLICEDILINTPLENYESEHQFERIFHMNPSIFPNELSIRTDTEYYVKDVGVVKYTSFIASSPVNIEMKLLRYSVN